MPEKNHTAQIVGMSNNGIKPINQPITSVEMARNATGIIANRKTLLTWLAMEHQIFKSGIAMEQASIKKAKNVT